MEVKENQGEDYNQKEDCPSRTILHPCLFRGTKIIFKDRYLKLYRTFGKLKFTGIDTFE